MIVESIFAIPGMGQLMVQAVFERDYPVLMGNLVIVSTLTLFANLSADLAYSLVDPRIRVGARAAPRDARARGVLARVLAATSWRWSGASSWPAWPSWRCWRPLHRAVGSQPARHQEDPRRRRRRATCSAPTSSAATCSRACSTARACRWPWASCRSASRPPSASCWAPPPATTAAWSTRSIMRLVDLMLVFPRFFLLLAVLAFLKPSIWTIMAVIGLTGWMGVARLVRAEFLALKEREFVHVVAVGRGERASGSSGATSCPTRWRPVLVAMTLGIPAAILTESGLSFLGLGVQPPHATWGNILNEGKDAIEIGLVAVGLPRPGHPRHGALLQPPRRGHPRRARSAPAPERRPRCLAARR